MLQELKSHFKHSSESKISTGIDCIEVDIDAFFDQYSKIVESFGVPTMILPVSRGVLVTFHTVDYQSGAHVLVRAIDPQTFEAQIKGAALNVDL